ncbi:MAG: extracellular solute-binding protein [Lachnospiraceae bacterium]|nr:extracellular solute-binding protein [Lachnospiraceae bacterium]
MNENLKKVLIVLGVVGAVVLLCVLLSLRQVDDFHDKYANADLSKDVIGLERTGTYAGYLSDYSDAKEADKDATIDLFKYTSEGEVEVVSDYKDEGVEKALYTSETSKVTWKVNVPETGFYNVYMEYLIPQSRGVAAERTVYINDELPFDGAKSCVFTRMYKDGGPKRVDNQGNEIRPTQVEEFGWQASYFKDEMGYYTEPYKFYFEKGENTFGLEGVDEPIVIKNLEVKAVKQSVDYAQYSANRPAVSATEAGLNYVQIVQGEESTVRSESSLYAKYDRSSPTTSPGSVTHTVLNYCGGDTWKQAGQWIEWEFEVPEDGYYNVTVKGRQNYQRGSVSSRIVSIDGEVPFPEMEEISFAYNTDWETKTLSDDNGTPYDIYLEKGKHTIRLEATLGGLGQILSDLESSTFRLNQIYRKLLVLTGVNPDKYRDYKIDSDYPEIIDAMRMEEMRLFKIVDDMTAFSGQKSDQIASAQTVAQQLERFIKRPQKITTEFVTFKDNVTALGTSQLQMSETKLDIDYLVITGSQAKFKKDKSNFVTKAWHEIKSFFASFFVDYNAIGNVYDDADDDEVIKVWVLTGRDQVTIVKSLIDESFVPETGIKVNVEVIDPSALLNAVLAGRGPNVVLSVGADQPVNYALRNAAEDLTQFEGWEEVFAHYSASSYEQYCLDDVENGEIVYRHIYGMPETQTFNVMFYREDILEELELGVPNTWKELIEMLPTIQGNNLSVGIPTAAGSSTTGAATTATMSNMPDLSMYFSLLYQYGGDMYNELGTHTTVDTEAGIAAFDDYVRYFNDYGLPTIYDSVSRFRSGEMPLIIGPYSMYNTLVVSAPEIRGLWDFTLIPGTEKEDGTIDRSDFITGSASMMIASDSESIKAKSWEFMKWWSRPEVQIQFGREIEALLGSSARYATANRDAFSSLPWSTSEIAILNEQWDNTVGIREVPGGYYTGRHISNAIRKVLNDKDDTRETIIDYSIKIDEEIKKKRTEFGMDTD